MLQEMDSKSQNLRDTETKLKLTLNDKELLQNKAKQFEQQARDWALKNEELGSRVAVLKQQLQAEQREKEELQISLNNKIEVLQYKLINGAKTEKGGSAVESSFKQILKLCQGDLQELTRKLQTLAASEDLEEQLRAEVIEQGRRMNELSSQHQTQLMDAETNFRRELELQEARFAEERD
jgi:hypothetical protein